MELEELKSIWKEQKEKELESYKVQIDEIRGLLGRKSQSAISKIKQTLRVKIAITGIVGTFCLVISGLTLFSFLKEAVFFEGFLSMKEEGILYLVLGTCLATISVFNIFSHIRISDFERSSLPIKETIEHVVKIIKGTMNLGMYSDLVVSPVILAFFAYALIYQKNLIDTGFPALIVSLVYIAGLLFSYYMNKWAMQRRFRNDLDRLKRYHEELEH